MDTERETMPFAHPLRALSWNSGAFFHSDPFQKEQHFHQAARWMRQGHSILVLQEAHSTEDRCRELEAWLCQQLRARVRVYGTSHSHNAEGTAGVVVVLQLDSLAVTREPKATAIVPGHAISVHIPTLHDNRRFLSSNTQ